MSWASSQQCEAYRCMLRIRRSEEQGTRCFNEGVLERIIFPENAQIVAAAKQVL